jgi:hypothetical protein
MSDNIILFIKQRDAFVGGILIKTIIHPNLTEEAETFIHSCYGELQKSSQEIEN